MAVKDALEDRARAVKNSWLQQEASIRSIGLRDEVLLPRLAKAWLAARTSLDALAEDFKRSAAAENTKNARRAFGIDDLVPTGADPAMYLMLYRDAQERVAETNGVQTLRILERAIETDDAVLARAAAVRGFKMRFTDVVELYEGERPGWAERAGNTAKSETYQNLWSVAVFRLPKPTELALLSQTKLEQLAADAA